MEDFLPGADCQLARPALVSYAMWNVRRGSNSPPLMSSATSLLHKLRPAKLPVSSTNNLHRLDTNMAAHVEDGIDSRVFSAARQVAPGANPSPRLHTNSTACNKSPWVPPAQAAPSGTTPSNQSVASAHALPSLVPQHDLPVQPAPYFQPVAPTLPPGNKFGSPILIPLLQFFANYSCGLDQSAQFFPFFSATPCQHYHPLPPDSAQPATFQKSYRRWISAIIQKRFDTAWDLLTHRNIEHRGLGSGQPLVKWITSHHPTVMPAIHRCHRPQY